MTPDEYLMWGRLVDRLACHHLIRHNAIPWAAPVPYFGNPDTALVATVSRQPSHGEFLDRSANELRGPRRRFHTLRSLGLRSWPDLRAEHSDRMAALCRAYFARNPLRQWLNRLAPALAATGCSYRDGAACHLSLLPYALSPNRNRALPDQEMQRLLSECGGPALAHVVRDAPIRLLILNGSAVVSSFERLAETGLAETERADWTLPGASELRRPGYAYRGIAERIAGVALPRPVLVIGFSHSLLSRYMDDRVRRAISQWVGQMAQQVQVEIGDSTLLDTSGLMSYAYDGR